MGGGSIQLARIFGIRVGVSPSWFFVLFLMIYSLSGYFDDVLSGSRQHRVRRGGRRRAAVLRLASSCTSSATRSSRGATASGSSGIDLWFFGGIAKMERDAESPGEEFRVAAAGPAVTLLIVGLVASPARRVAVGDAATSSTSRRFARRPAPRPASRCSAGWLSINAVLLRLQPHPRLPARRRPHRPRDRLEGDRRPQPRARSCPGASARSSRTLLIGLGVVRRLPRRHGRRHLVRAAGRGSSARPPAARSSPARSPSASRASRSPT